MYLQIYDLLIYISIYENNYLIRKNYAKEGGTNEEKYEINKRYYAYCTSNYNYCTINTFRN